MPTKTSPKPPIHLSPTMKVWYVSVYQNYRLESHHEKLLLLACQTFDRAEQARKALAEHGMVYMDRFGCPRNRPEVAIERDSRLAYARLVRELGLDLAEPEMARPNIRSGIRGR